MPPSNLVDILVARFYSRLYCVFPMVQQDDFQKQYDQLKRMETGDDDFIPVLFAILALSAPMLSLDDPVFDQPDCAQYRQSNLGIYFYSVARNALDNTHYTVVTLGALTSPLGTQKNSINKVMALGLLAAYLAGTGNEAEAWTTVGSVVRLGQDLGLHVSTITSRLDRLSDTVTSIALAGEASPPRERVAEASLCVALPLRPGQVNLDLSWTPACNKRFRL